jgi:hypothetical protein
MRLVRIGTGKEYEYGRLSLALEILTVVKTLEDERVPMLALQRAETISVLRTLLVDQGMDTMAETWYDFLVEWRQPKFVAEGVSVPASADVTLQDALALAESTRAELDERQSLALPSGESDEQTTGEDEATRIELSESPDAALLVETLQDLRIRHGIGLQPDPDHSEPES